MSSMQPITASKAASAAEELEEERQEKGDVISIFKWLKRAIIILININIKKILQWKMFICYARICLLSLWEDLT